MQRRIHLPLVDKRFISVKVTDTKFYGRISGQQLIKDYGKRPRQPEPLRPPKPDKETILHYDTCIWIPFGTLPEKIQISERRYNTKDFFRLVEQIIGTQILCKRENKAIRRFRNVSFRLPIIYNENFFEPLKIVTHEKEYLLTPSFK